MTGPGPHGGHVAAAPTLGSRETGAARGVNENRVYREGDGHNEVEVQRFEYQAGAFNPQQSSLVPSSAFASGT